MSLIPKNVSHLFAKIKVLLRFQTVILLNILLLSISLVKISSQIIFRALLFFILPRSTLILLSLLNFF